MSDSNGNVLEMEKSIAVLQEMQRVNSEQATLQFTATTDLTKEISVLVSEMRVRDVKNVLLHDKVSAISTTMDTYKPIIERLNKSHKRWDVMVNSIYSNIGKLILAVILVGVVVSFGLNFDDLKKMAP